MSQNEYISIHIGLFNPKNALTKQSEILWLACLHLDNGEPIKNKCSFRQVTKQWSHSINENCLSEKAQNSDVLLYDVIYMYTNGHSV